jgi:3-hydroxyisobutyrate dehydrogenase-like beta-hydroxyacid dehydrogenase
MTTDELATVYTTTHPADAEMVRAALEEEGLAAFVEGAKQAGLAGVLNVRVCVAQQNADEARRLIDEMARSPISAEAWDEAVGETVDEDSDG